MSIVAPVDVPWRAGQPIPQAWIRYFQDVAAALNAPTSPTDMVSKQTEVLGGAGLNGGGDLSTSRTVRLYIVTDRVSNLPTTGVTQGSWAYASDGRNSGEGAGSGTGVAVTWNGSIWHAPGVGTAVAA